MSLKILYNNFKVAKKQWGSLGEAITFTGKEGLSKFLDTFTGKALVATTATYAMAKGLEYLADKYNLSYDAAIKNTEESVSGAKSTREEIEKLKSESDSYRETLSSLGEKYDISFSSSDDISDMITKLRQVKDISLTDSTELSKITQQNAELENQIELKQKLLTTEQKEAADNAKDTLNRGKKSVADQVAIDLGDKGGKKDSVKNVNTVDAIKEDIAAIKEYEDKIKILEEEQKEFKSKSKEWNKAQEDIEAYNEAINTLTKDMQSKEGDLSTLMSALSVDGEGLVGLKGYEKDFNAVKEAFDELNSRNLSLPEKQLKSIQDFFDKSTGNKFISEQLSDMASKAELTADDILRMGIAIDGVDASTIAKYFNDMAKSAKEAADATTKFGTLEEYETALESENAGDDYLKIAEGLKKTKELYDKGLVGTDDFKSYAKMLSPTGKTDDKNFIENYKNLKKYFTDDESGSKKFLNELSKNTDKAGQSFATLDEATGQWKLNIKDTTEAAKALGMGIVPFESLLGRLQDYGFDIDFRSAVQDLTDVQTALGGFDDLLSKMEDGERKDALKQQVDDWKEQLPNWEEDLSKLDTDVALKIKLEYSLAEIQAKIDEFKNSIDWGNATSENYAGLLSGNDQYISKAESALGLDKEGFKAGEQYVNVKANIKDLQEQLKNATSEEEKIEIQAEIENLQEIQKNLLDAFSDAHPEINADSSLEEIQTAWNDFVNSAEGKEILGNYDIDVSEAQNKINGILSEDGKTITMNVDASTENIQYAINNLKQGQRIIFTADVDGVEGQVEAVKDQNGNISYAANVNGVLTYLEKVQNPDGTISYTVGEYPKAVPDADQNVNRHPNDLEVLVNPKAVNQQVNRKPNNSGVLTPPPAVTQAVKRVVTSVSDLFKGTSSGFGKFNGTAHVNGTVRRGNAFVNGNWGANKTEKSLVGELGRETIKL